MFARYSLIGALAAAAGSLAAASPDFMQTLGMSHLGALKGMFLIYALLGLAGGCLYARIPADRATTAEKSTAALGPSRGIVYKMAGLFSIDAFAGGFAVQSLLALWLFGKFGLSLPAASLFFFWSGILAAEAERVFGKTIVNADGRIVPVRYIAEQHIKEDCGDRIPSVSDWLSQIKPAVWMSRGYPPDARLALSTGDELAPVQSVPFASKSSPGS